LGRPGNSWFLLTGLDGTDDAGRGFWIARLDSVEMGARYFLVGLSKLVDEADVDVDVDESMDAIEAAEAGLRGVEGTSLEGGRIELDDFDECIGI
jgi:hypothetical protein